MNNRATGEPPGHLTADKSLSEASLERVLAILVRTKSVNPGTSEAAMIERISGLLAPTGAELSVVEFAPGRPSLAAVLTGRTPGPSLVFNGHTDTVPVDDPTRWHFDPFAAEVRDGFLYGRGACDMKGGLTAQMAVAHYLSKRVDRMRGRLVLHFAGGEEYGEPGTLALVKAGFVGEFGIVTEPTGLNVATAQRGFAAFRIRILGRGIHASQPQLGINPVVRLPAVLAAIEAYEQDIGEQRHPLLGTGSATPTVVRAGVKENAVADYCDVVVDRRLLPGETPQNELAKLQRYVAAVGNNDPDFRFEISIVYAIDSSEGQSDGPLPTRILELACAITGTEKRIVGTPFGSDVRNLINDAGMEAITFGPGEVGECHCADERVSIRQVRDAALVLAEFTTDLLLEEGGSE